MDPQRNARNQRSGCSPANKRHRAVNRQNVSWDNARWAAPLNPKNLRGCVVSIDLLGSCRTFVYWPPHSRRARARGSPKVVGVGGTCDEGTFPQADFRDCPTMRFWPVNWSLGFRIFVNTLCYSHDARCDVRCRRRRLITFIGHVGHCNCPHTLGYLDFTSSFLGVLRPSKSSRWPPTQQCWCSCIARPLVLYLVTPRSAPLWFQSLCTFHSCWIGSTKHSLLSNHREQLQWMQRQASAQWPSLILTAILQQPLSSKVVFEVMWSLFLWTCPVNILRVLFGCVSNWCLLY